MDTNSKHALSPKQNYVNKHHQVKQVASASQLSPSFEGGADPLYKYKIRKTIGTHLYENPAEIGKLFAEFFTDLEKVIPNEKEVLEYMKEIATNLYTQKNSKEDR